MAPQVNPQLVKRFGAVIMVVNIAVAFFSVTDMYLLASGAIQVDPPGEDSFETGYDPLSMEFVFKSKYKVTNDGFYNVNDLDISSTLRTEDGEVLIDYRSNDLQVPRWTSRTFPIEARMPIERLLDLDMERILFEDMDFDLKVRVGADYVMGLVHFDMDQERAFPWRAPLQEYRDVLGNISIVEIVEDLLGGDYHGASSKIGAAVYGAFMANGGEVKVAITDYSDLVVYLEEEVLHVKVDIQKPFQLTLLHFEISLSDLVPAPAPSIEGQGGGSSEG